MPIVLKKVTKDDPVNTETINNIIDAITELQAMVAELQKK